jgi:broad specificity phosphatase PhoE
MYHVAALASLAIPSRVAPDMRRLILIRHGAVDRERAEPAIKPGGFYGGNVDVPLSQMGEAEALAVRLSNAIRTSGRLR